jgi:hypothetical protein
MGDQDADVAAGRARCSRRRALVELPAAQARPRRHAARDLPRGDLLPPLAARAGFALQRVYTDDRSLDETLTFGDRDCVLVPRGYHTVSAPPATTSTTST